MLPCHRWGFKISTSCMEGKKEREARAILTSSQNNIKLAVCRGISSSGREHPQLPFQNRRCHSASLMRGEVGVNVILPIPSSLLESMHGDDQAVQAISSLSPRPSYTIPPLHSHSKRQRQPYPPSYRNAKDAFIVSVSKGQQWQSRTKRWA